MEQRLRRVMADPRNAVFVADEPSPVGWIQVSIVESLEGGGFAEILGLVVASAHRRTGVGADLVRKAESWARENGCSRIRVRTNIVRSDAHAFYARLGYGLKKRQEVFDKKLE
ncbi:MAG TPA: GNAT family N-acetyltransferase [Bacteroidota bacterium]|nr:GNAT family N-acetyltransferase [Bacteroidota bacterium]